MQRIPLTNVAFEGNNNAYLITDDDVTALVDTGDPMPGTREHLESSLADQGVSFADVDEVFLTHWHGDHSGLAGEIQAAGGATVRIHAADAPLVAEEPGAHEAMEERQGILFEQWGMPESKRRTLRSFFDQGPFESPPPEVEPFEDGDRFTVGDRELRVVHAPGHAAGLCLFEFEGDRGVEVFSGDALLPVYTPNVGGADVRVEEALRKYLRALVGIVQAGYERAWPGHRDPIDDPAGRAAEIIRHHEERSWRVLDVLERRGPADAWTVSDALFGELESIHILHGPGESYAHLDHLRRDGVVELTDRGYVLADGVADRLSDLETERWTLVDRDAAGDPASVRPAPENPGESTVG